MGDIIKDVMKFWQVGAILFALFLTAGCAEKSVPQDPPPYADFWKIDNSDGAHSGGQAAPTLINQAPDEEDPDHFNKVAPGFLFEISHPEDKSLKGKYRVGFDGNILLPYHVQLKASGQTLQGFTDKVVKAYQYYFKDGTPVTINLSERRYWVDVRGLVNKPTQYLVSDGTSLDEVIAMAGGLLLSKDERADIYVKIQRSSGVRLIDLASYYQQGNADLSPKWRGGELLFFQRGANSSSDSSIKSLPPITVLGAVNKPGEVSYKESRDIFYYLSQAGGQGSYSDMSKIDIVRKYEGKNYTTTFDSREVGKIPQLLPGDVVIVGKDKLTPFERVAQTAGSIAAVISAVAILIFVL